MKIDKLSFPHPVLISDDGEIPGNFEIDLEYSLGDNIELAASVDIENNYLMNLIDSGRASICMEVDCKATVFKKLFKFNQSEFSKKIDHSLLAGKVKVGLFVLVEERIDNYTPDHMHEDYEGFEFSVDKGDILAYGDNFSFLAVKDEKKLSAPESLIKVRKGDKREDHMKVVLQNDIIEVFLSKKDFEEHGKIQNSSRKMAEMFHSAIVLPALVYAINISMRAGEDFEGVDWYEIIKHRVENEMEESWDESNVMEIAQNLLESPVQRSIKRGWELISTGL